MFSRASRRSAWKSGWRNVQLWKEEGDISICRSIGGGNTRSYMLAILVLVRVLDLVEVVLVELADEACKVGVLEHAGEDGFCELVHVFYDESVTGLVPRDDVVERVVLEHPART